MADERANAPSKGEANPEPSLGLPFGIWAPVYLYLPISKQKEESGLSTTKHKRNKKAPQSITFKKCSVKSTSGCRIYCCL